jgi:hypothetical protein
MVRVLRREKLQASRWTSLTLSLTGMLEDASFEIIGNPSLIGTEQWQYAVQLFRTKSLDSLVRYFSSYLPEEHPWHHDSGSPISSTESSHPTIFDCDGPMFFDEPEEDTYYTNEHSQSFDATDVSINQPTRSMTVRSEDSGVSVSELVQQKHHKYDIRTSQRAMSFSESEPDRGTVALHESMPTLHDDDGTSQSDDPETPSTSISDLSDVDEPQGKDMMVTTIVDDYDHNEYVSISHTQLSPMGSTSSMESETPTPKPQHTRSPAAPFFDTRLSPFRNISSSRTCPHHGHPAHEDFSGQHSTTRSLRRRDVSLDRQRQRCASRGKSGRVQKPTADTRGFRQRGRRHISP